jgi:hypothetical protein
MKKNSLFLLLASIVYSSALFAQTEKSSEPKKEYYVAGIGFYNLENLFDTIIDTDTNKILQDDFTPKGNKAWTGERYYQKLENLSKVLSELGTDVNPEGLACIGVSEIENKAVLEDLVKTEKLKSRNYQIVHYESPDKRGIDVGFLYNPTNFKVISSQSYTLINPDDSNFKTRDQLVVNGELNGELIHVIVAHWPSRSGGEKRSAPKRILAGQLARAIIDSIQKINLEAKILFMGDLNDDPTNASVKKQLNTVAKKEDIQANQLFNPMESFHKKGIGSLAYRDTWNLFDQIIVSPGLVNGDYSTYKYYSAKVYNKPYMKQASGRYQGYPFRTYAGGAYAGGYSDHFPVYLFLIKEK